MEKKKLDVLFVQHEEYVKPGEYLNWVERNGCRLRTIRCWEQEEFPQPEKLPDLLVVLGGPQNPGTTREECPYYDAEAEMRLICRCRDAGRMVVGACLGAQLMSEAFGGKFSHSPNREVGPTLLTLTEAGRRDPFLRAFPEVRAAPCRSCASAGISTASRSIWSLTRRSWRRSWKTFRTAWPSRRSTPMSALRRRSGTLITVRLRRCSRPSWTP